MAPLPAKRFQSFDEMLAEIQAPRPKRFRLARLMVIGAAVAAAVVTLNDQNSILSWSTVTTALKSELAAASARVAGSLEPSLAGGVAGSTPVKPSPPEETPSVAAVLQEPISVPESESVPAPEGPLPPQLEPVSAAPEPVALQPVALESAAPLQMPAQSNPDAISATLLTEVSQQAEANSDSIETPRNQCIAQCERDDGECRTVSRRGQQECIQAASSGSDTSRQDCDEKGRESDRLCLDELQTCVRSCE
jgi:hypothetical protein